MKYYGYQGTAPRTTRMRRASAGLNAKRTRFTRRLRHEQLEQRMLLAGLGGAQNPVQPMDVTGDARVAPLDVLTIINHLNDLGPGPMNQPTAFGFLDTNGDGMVTALDALMVINSLNRGSPLIGARLLEDGGPVGIYRRDFVTNRYGIEVAVTNPAAGPLEMRIDGDAGGVFYDIDSWLHEDGVLDEQTLDSIAGAPLSDGVHLVELRHAGEVIEFSFILDRQRPEPSITPFSKNPAGEISPLVLHFGKAMPSSVLDASNYLLARAEGEAIEVIDVALVGQDSVELTVSDDVINVGSYSLQLGSGIVDAAGNAAESTELTFQAGNRIDYAYLKGPVSTWLVHSFDHIVLRPFESRQPTFEPFNITGALDSNWPVFMVDSARGAVYQDMKFFFYNDVGLLAMEYEFEEVQLTQARIFVDVPTGEQRVEIQLFPKELIVRVRDFDEKGEPFPWVERGWCIPCNS